VRVRVIRPRAEGAVAAVQRLVVPAELQQGDAAVIEGFGVGRIDRKGGVVSLECFPPSFHCQ
jgi:hypothetical protein